MLLPRLFGWNIHQNDKFFLTFLIATHFATAIVLLLFFLQGLGADRQGHLPLAADARDPRGRHLRPARVAARRGRRSRSAIIGLLLQDPIRKLFASPSVAAAFLIVNGIALLCSSACAAARRARATT